MILKRLDDGRFSEVLPAWLGETVVVVGCGPSLTRGQQLHVRAAHSLGICRMIVVNDAYLWAPWADVHYAADSHWHRWHSEGIEKPLLGLRGEEVRIRWARFSGQKCTIQNSGANVADEAVHVIRNRDHPRHGTGLSVDPKVLVTGRNSGFQALNLATLAGARRVLLIGFDGGVRAGGPGHFHGDHPRLTPADVYPMQRAAMREALEPLRELGVEVVNCTPGSQIDAFPMACLQEVL